MEQWWTKARKFSILLIRKKCNLWVSKDSQESSEKGTQQTEFLDSNLKTWWLRSRKLHFNCLKKIKSGDLLYNEQINSSTTTLINGQKKRAIINSPNHSKNKKLNNFLSNLMSIQKKNQGIRNLEIFATQKRTFSSQTQRCIQLNLNQKNLSQIMTKRMRSKRSLKI